MIEVFFIVEIMFLQFSFDKIKLVLLYDTLFGMCKQIE